MDAQTIIETITKTQAEAIQSYVENYHGYAESCKNYRKAAKNYEQDEPGAEELMSEYAQERNHYSNEAMRLHTKIDSAIRQLTGSTWTVGFWEFVCKKYDVSVL